MQTWSGPDTGKTTSSANKLMTYIILFFSLAGLIAGFAIGGFLRSSTGTPTNNITPVAKTTAVIQATTRITPTPTPEIITPLGIPQFQNTPDQTESLAAGKVHTFSMQVIDKNKKPVAAPDITCKAWLVQQIPDNQNLLLPDDALKTISTLTSPIAGTINNQPAPEVSGLNFDQTTPQTGLCNASGQMTWKYTLATTLTPGTYDIVILADWKGVHWNWSWDNIKVVA